MLSVLLKAFYWAQSNPDQDHDVEFIWHNCNDQSPDIPDRIPWSGLIGAPGHEASCQIQLGSKSQLTPLRPPSPWRSLCGQKLCCHWSLSRSVLWKMSDSGSWWWDPLLRCEARGCMISSPFIVLWSLWSMDQAWPSSEPSLFLLRSLSGEWWPESLRHHSIIQ